MTLFETGITFGAIIIAFGLGLVVYERQRQWPRNSNRHFGGSE